MNNRRKEPDGRYGGQGEGSEEVENLAREAQELLSVKVFPLGYFTTIFPERFRNDGRFIASRYQLLGEKRRQAREMDIEEFGLRKIKILEKGDQKRIGNAMYFSAPTETKRFPVPYYFLWADGSVDPYTFNKALKFVTECGILDEQEKNECGQWYENFYSRLEKTAEIANLFRRDRDGVDVGEVAPLGIKEVGRRSDVDRIAVLRNLLGEIDVEPNNVKTAFREISDMKGGDLVYEISLKGDNQETSYSLISLRGLRKANSQLSALERIVGFYEELKVITPNEVDEIMQMMGGTFEDEGEKYT